MRLERIYIVLFQYISETKLTYIMTETLSLQHEISICDLCGNDKDSNFNKCCGINVCFPCDAKLYGKCCICDRIELNQMIGCETCGKECTNMLIAYCPYCDKMVCSTCLHINESPLNVCNKNECINAFMKDYSDDSDFSDSD